MWYIWGNSHVDNNHVIDWGYDIFKYLEVPHNKENEKFNSGYRTLFDLEDMKCPCGKHIKHSKFSTMWATCGSWACSALCHDRYIQSKGKWLFIRNFIKNRETSQIQGMRNILYLNINAMHKDGKPEHTPCSRVSPKFMKAALGPNKNTVYAQRGFRQYGQPCKETLDGIVDIVDKEEDEAYIFHRDRLCQCTWEIWMSMSPHSVHNCSFQCLNLPELSEKEVQKLGLLEGCEWSCNQCYGMPTHRMADCMYFWHDSKFKKIL